MYEPYSGGRDGYQPYPGGSRQPDQPDHWPDDEWFRPQRGQERGPSPHDIADERGRGRHHHHGDRRRPGPDRTTARDLQATVVDLLERKAGRNWALIVGAVFFLVDTLLLADGFARPVGVGSRVLVIFIWLISLAAVALLWLRSSSMFFKSSLLIRAGARAHQR